MVSCAESGRAVGVKQPIQPGLCVLFCLGTSIVHAGAVAVKGDRLPAGQRHQLWADMENAGLSPEEMGRLFRAFLGAGAWGASPWIRLEELLARCNTALEQSFSRRELLVFDLGGSWALAALAAAEGWPSAKAQRAFVAEQLSHACKCAAEAGVPVQLNGTVESVRVSEQPIQAFADEILSLREPLLRTLSGH